MFEDVIDTDEIPLANPKGVKHKCEVCGKLARYRCSNCNSAFYCSKEHQVKDLRLIHFKTCKFFAFLATPVPFSTSAQERARLETQRFMKKQEVLDIALSLTHRSLFRNRPRDAVRQVTWALKISNALYGEESVKAMPLLLLYASALIRQKQPELAHYQITKARSILLSNPDCSYVVQADYYANEGHFHVAMQDYEEASTSYANEIYFATYAYHTEHPRTSCGFFHLGRVFFLRGETSTANEYYVHCVDIWLVRLGEAFRELITEDEVERISIGAHSEKIVLTEEEKANSSEVLKGIMLDTVAADWNGSFTDSVKITCALGLLHFILGDHASALEVSEQASQFIKLCEPGPDTAICALVHDLRKRSLKLNKKSLEA